MQKLLNRAMSLLARRDHSEYELRRKLAAQSAFNPSPKYRKAASLPDCSEILSKDELNNQIETVIQYCYEYRWLDDKKFAANFIHSRSLKGYGPHRIKSELKQKGIDSDTISAAFADCGIDWVQLIQALIEKSYGHRNLSHWEIKAKVYNQLVNKGFSYNDVNLALKNLVI